MTVHEEIDHAIDHSEMIVPLELVLQIDEVAVHPVETTGEEAAEMQVHRGMRLKKGDRIGDDVEARDFERPHLGSVWHAKEDGKITEDRTGFVRPGDGNLVLGHLDAAFDEKVEQTGVIALSDHNLIRREFPHGLLQEFGEKGRHEGKNYWLTPP